MKLSFFLGSAILAGYLLFLAGAPPLAIAAGVALAGFYTYRKRVT